MNRVWRSVFVGLAMAAVAFGTGAVLASSVLPMISVPDHVQGGTELVGSAWSPNGGVSVTVRMGSVVLYKGGGSDYEVDFMVYIPFGSSGVVTVEAEDSLGNHSTADVPIVP